jgi:hypothetical protein
MVAGVLIVEGGCAGLEEGPASLELLLQVKSKRAGVLLTSDIFVVTDGGSIREKKYFGTVSLN